MTHNRVHIPADACSQNSDPWLDSISAGCHPTALHALVQPVGIYLTSDMCKLWQATGLSLLLILKDVLAGLSVAGMSSLWGRIVRALLAP